MAYKHIITLPKEKMVKKFTNQKLTFTVGNLRSLNTCIITPKLKLYNYKDESVYEYYKGQQWVVANNYKEYTYTFFIQNEDIQNTTHMQIELEVIGLTPKHPIYFNNLMLNEGDYTPYHQPDQSLEETSIYFVNNFYVNLYTRNNDSYLEIIRPNFDNFTTKVLKQSKTTILTPHLVNEDKIESSENIALEYMNMSDQVIEILR